MIPNLTVRMRSSLRTVYTTGVCLGLLEIHGKSGWTSKWAGESTYLSPVLSTISGKAIYFGQWMSDIYKISYSTTLGSCLGVAIGLLKGIIPLQLMLLFFCIATINRVSYWDHLTKVIASLTLVLGTLRPYISGYGGSELLKELLALIIIPFAITGVTLLVPWPSLAANSARSLCVNICDDLKESLDLIHKTFDIIDSFELYAVKLDHLLKDIDAGLNELKVLHTFISNEVILFRRSKHLNTILPIFIDRTTQAANEIQNCRKFLHNIRDNSTQKVFAMHLKQPIIDLCQEINIIIQLINDHFAGEECNPYPVLLSRCLQCFHLHVKDKANEYNNDEESGTRIKVTALDILRSSSKRLIVAMEEIFNAYQYTRVKFLFKKYKTEDDSIITVSINDNLVEEKYSIVTQDESTAEDLQLIERLKYENDRLALRNLGPRMAFLYSLTSIAKIIASYEDMLIIEDTKVSFKFILDAVIDVRNYLVDGLIEMKKILLLFIGSINRIYKSRSFSEVPSNTDDKKRIIEPNPLPLLIPEVVPYVQPCKIALSIIIASLFVVLPQLRNSDYSIWSVVVITFIRSNDSSSSFNLGYQRLEGTVIGSVFSFALFTGFRCSDINSNQCTPSSLYPLLLVWIGICVYFREGEKHGYSALVSAFTPIVILLNLNNRHDSNVAWSRIEQTLLGICIYLVVDNLILPIRVKTFIRLSALKGVEQVRVAFAESINAVRSIVVLNDIMRKRNNSLCISNVSLDDTSLSGGGSNADVEQEIDDYNNSSFMEFRVCSDRLSRADEQITKLHKNVTKIADLCKLSSNEPELYHKPFPTVVYLDLVTKFSNIIFTNRALTIGIMKLSNKLQSMSEKYDGFDDITLHFSTFDYFIKHIIILSDKSDVALRSAYKALRLLFEHEDSENNLDDIVTLARTSEKLLGQCDEHFRMNYLKQQTLAMLDPRFILSWQNCFENCFDLVQRISNLGIALLNIREVEAHNMKLRKNQ